MTTASRVADAAPVSPLIGSAELRRRFPTLAEAVDGEAMRARLRQVPALDGAVERCRPGKLLVGADGCRLRYHVEVRDRQGAPRTALLLGCVLPTPDAAAAYHARVARLGGETAWVATLDELALVVHPFPLDPGLPTLRAAVTEDAVLPTLRRLVDEDLDGCTVELAGYPRQDRCVVRYRLRRSGLLRGGPGCGDVFGKVHADDEGASATSILSAVRGALARADADLQVPRPLGHDTRLRLALTARAAGTVPALAVPGERERLVATAGAVAALLHGVGPPLPRRRTVTGELERLGAEVATVSELWPDLGAECDQWVQRLRAAAAATSALPARFGHGDLTPAQFLFDLDRPAVAVVDFDDAAMAEPALDLGRFLAHLRLGLARHSAQDDADRLGRTLLAAYLEASPRATRAGGAALAPRVALCSSLSLLGSALHACRQLKYNRVARALAALSKEAACLS